jgi:hypothetical protein
LHYLQVPRHTAACVCSGDRVSLSATMRFVNTVARYSHASGNRERLNLAEQLRLDSHVARYGRAAKSFVDYRWHKLGSRPSLEAVVSDSITALVDCMTEATRQADMSGALEVEHSQETDVFDLLSDSFMRGAERGSHFIKENVKSKAAQTEAFSTFVGTNGTYGIVCGSASSLSTSMYIAVFADATQSQNALLLQQTTGNCWYIVGIAHVFETIPKPTNHGVFNVFRPDGVLRRFVIGTSHGACEEKPSVFQALGWGGPYIKICLQYCGLLDLLDLSRCKVLEQRQLRDILRHAVAAEVSDSPHQCSENVDQCNFLRVGTTWSG